MHRYAPKHQLVTTWLTQALRVVAPVLSYTCRSEALSTLEPQATVRIYVSVTPTRSYHHPVGDISATDIQHQPVNTVVDTIPMASKGAVCVTGSRLTEGRATHRPAQVLQQQLCM